jgi:hypothetical protein
MAARRSSIAHDSVDSGGGGGGGAEPASKRGGGGGGNGLTTATRKSWRKSLDLMGDSVGGDDEDVVTGGAGDGGDDIDSPRTPKYFPRELALSNRLGGLRPDSLVPNNAVVAAAARGRVKSGSSSVDNLSTPYSTLSGISNYEYEDDFTSDEEEAYSATPYHKSRPSSRIPISRSSSLRRRKSLLLNGNSSGGAAAVPRPHAQLSSPIEQDQADEGQRRQQQSPVEAVESATTAALLNRRRTVAASPQQEHFSSRWEETVTTTTITQLETVSIKSPLDGEKAAVAGLPARGAAASRRAARTQSVPPGSQATRSGGQAATGAPVAVTKSSSDLSSAERQPESGGTDRNQTATAPQTEPPTRRYNHSMSVPGTRFKIFITLFSTFGEKSCWIL